MKTLDSESQQIDKPQPEAGFCGLGHDQFASDTLADSDLSALNATGSTPVTVTVPTRIYGMMMRRRPTGIIYRSHPVYTRSSSGGTRRCPAIH